MKGRNVFMWIIGIILFLILLIIIWFIIPFSPLKNKFKSVIEKSINENNLEYSNFQNEVYSEEDIKDLPIPFQKYFRYIGLIGKPKISNVHVRYESTDFKLSQDKPMLKIKYQHYNFLKDLNRIAYIDASMFGIPFEGLDNYTNGKGSMTGILGKSLTLFDVTGDEMNVSSLITCLSEMIFLPSVVLEDYITWETIDNNTVKAIINHNNYIASGIFKFKDNGEIISFETNDRYMDEGNGKSSKHPWLVDVLDYIEENGIKHPNRAKATWKLDTGDYLYFDGKGISLDYNVK